MHTKNVDNRFINGLLFLETNVYLCSAALLHSRSDTHTARYECERVEQLVSCLFGQQALITESNVDEICICIHEGLRGHGEKTYPQDSKAADYKGGGKAGTEVMTLPTRLNNPPPAALACAALASASAFSRSAERASASVFYFCTR